MTFQGAKACGHAVTEGSPARSGGCGRRLRGVEAVSKSRNWITNKGSLARKEYYWDVRECTSVEDVQRDVGVSHEYWNALDGLRGWSLEIGKSLTKALATMENRYSRRRFAPEPSEKRWGRLKPILHATTEQIDTPWLEGASVCSSTLSSMSRIPPVAKSAGERQPPLTIDCGDACLPSKLHGLLITSFYSEAWETLTASNMLLRTVLRTPMWYTCNSSSIQTASFPLTVRNAASLVLHAKAEMCNRHHSTLEC